MATTTERLYRQGVFFCDFFIFFFGDWLISGFFVCNRQMMSQSRFDAAPAWTSGGRGLHGRESIDSSTRNVFIMAIARVKEGHGDAEVR